MSDFSKRNYGGRAISGLQGDIERGLSGLRKDLDASTSYTPGDATSWADPQPTTMAEALDRIAAAVAAVHGAIA